MFGQLSIYLTAYLRCIFLCVTVCHCDVRFYALGHLRYWVRYSIINSVSDYLLYNRYSGTASSITCQSSAAWTTSSGCTIVSCSSSPTQAGYTIATGASTYGSVCACMCLCCACECVCVHYVCVSVCACVHITSLPTCFVLRFHAHDVLCFW